MAERTPSRRQALAWLAGGLVPAMAVGRSGGRAVVGGDVQQNDRSARPPVRPSDSLVAELMDPTRAGKLRGRVTEYENHPVVVGVEERIRCTCGCNLSVYTCRTTDFTCETSPAMHQQVVERMEQGQSAQEIVDAFVSQYGESVLMAPPRKGFNLAGYLVPGIVITLVGGALAVMIVRQTRMQAVGRSGGQAGTPGADRLSARPPDGPDQGSTLPPGEQARIRAELEKLGM